jgi:predicted AAA+ superfamily ATPase
VGRKLETAVFLHWRRQREDLGYLAGDREVDLVVNRDRPEQLINVAYSVSASLTWAREIAGLEAAAVRFPRAKRVLVAHEHARRTPPAGVQVTDAWRHLLASPTPGA